MSNSSDHYSEFGFYLHRVVALIDKQGDALFRRELGISLGQFTLLRLFEAEPRMPSQQLIADRLGIAKSAVSRQIESAERRGWVTVETSPQSRRQNTLTLTDAGRRLLVAAKALLQRSEEQGFGDLPPDDVEATLRTLRTLHGKLTSM